jgi:putative transposase
LYFYFSGLSLRRTAERLSSCFAKRNHVSIWNWIQKYKPKKISSKRKKIEEVIIDETLIKASSEYIWLWVVIESESKRILGFSISKERNILIAERFVSKLVNIYGSHPVSTDGGTWYPQACRFLKLKHHLHSSLEKSLIERTIQYIKDRTECFDDYFPCRKEKICAIFLVKTISTYL